MLKKRKGSRLSINDYYQWHIQGGTGMMFYTTRAIYKVTASRAQYLRSHEAVIAWSLLALHSKGNSQANFTKKDLFQGQNRFLHWQKHLEVFLLKNRGEIPTNLISNMVSPYHCLANISNIAWVIITKYFLSFSPL